MKKAVGLEAVISKCAMKSHQGAQGEGRQLVELRAKNIHYFCGLHVKKINTSSKCVRKGKRH
jgi:hypothetical protein